MAKLHPYYCPKCGAPSPKKLEIVRTRRGEMPALDPGQEIFRTKDTGQKSQHHWVWSGEYEHQYEPFCTLRCGHAYGVEAWLKTQE